MNPDPKESNADSASALAADLNFLITTHPYPGHQPLTWKPWKKPGWLCAEAGLVAYELGAAIIKACPHLKYVVEEKMIGGSWDLRSYHLCIGPCP